MSKRVWVIGGAAVGVTVVTVIGVLVWRTSQLVGLVTEGEVDLGVELSATPDGAPPVRREARAQAHSDVVKDQAKTPRIPRPDGYTPDNLKLDTPRLSLRHEARTAWREALTEEELEAVRERVREKQVEMSAEERAARKDRRDARLEAIGLNPDAADLDPAADDWEPLPEDAP